MTTSFADLVKKLRAETDGKMIDCQEALKQCDGDLQRAEEWLRKKGMLAAGKKSSRATGEGVVAAVAHGEYGVLMEINCETDFVTRNEEFQKFCHHILAVASTHYPKSLDELIGLSSQGKKETIEEERLSLIGKIGENIMLRRFAALSVNPGMVVSYTHSPICPSLGKIGVLVAIECTEKKEGLAEMGKKVAMHIAAMDPKYLSINDVPQEAIERERNILTEQARTAGNPEERIPQIVEGRIKKFFGDSVLEEQAFVYDSSKKVKEFLEEQRKNLQTPFKICGFVRMMRGQEDAPLLS